MTAEQMFNQIGLVKRVYETNDWKNIEYSYWKDDNYLDFFRSISFILKDDGKDVQSIYISSDDGATLDVNVLKCIYKQCQELGWIEQTIKINKIEHYKWEE